jgi:hypothetical protein
MQKKSKPARFKTEACGPTRCPVTRNLPPGCSFRDTRAFCLVFSVSQKLPVLVWSDDPRLALLRHAKAILCKQGMRLRMDQSSRL